MPATAPNAAECYRTLDLEQVKSTTLALLSYCQANDWAGYDPYDALNSRLFRLLPFLDYRWPRLIFTQAMKRSPINLRPLFLIPKTQNPKGLALFLSALVKLSRVGLVPDQSVLVTLADRLITLRSPQCPHWCWGYNFAWQQRYILVPPYSPNIISTTFVANALLDLYEQCPDAQYLTMAVSAAEYILRSLYCDESPSVAYFSYTPIAKSKVHNASLLGAAFLGRVGKLTGDSKWFKPALKAAQFSVSRQAADGSWPYGEHPTQAWIDNFHTGYNLLALHALSHDMATDEFETALVKGLAFYRAHFFGPDGAPKYFHNQTYPIDIHSIALSLITLSTLTGSAQSPDHDPLIKAIFRWAMLNMWDEHGYFYYQKFPYHKVKIPYMRWGQAWMLLALSTLLETNNDER